MFYGWWDWHYLFLLLGSAVVNWAFGKAVYNALTPDGERTDASKWLVRGAVVANLGVLGYFKYFEFFATSISERLTSLGISVDPPMLEIILPVGISFFTFQAISYVIDIGRGGGVDPLPLLDFSVYLSFFAAPGGRPDRPGQRVRPAARHEPVPHGARRPRRSGSSSGACSRRW